MSIAGHVYKETDRTIAFLTAHIAFEDIVATVIAHVYGIQDSVLEVNITIFAFVNGAIQRWRR